MCVVMGFLSMPGHVCHFQIIDVALTHLENWCKRFKFCELLVTKDKAPHKHVFHTFHVCRYKTCLTVALCVLELSFAFWLQRYYITVFITCTVTFTLHYLTVVFMCVAPITQWANQVWGPDSAGNGIDILCLIWHCSCQCGLIAILYWSQWFFLIAQLSCIVLLWAHNSSFVGRLCLRQLHSIYFSLSLAGRDLAGIQLSRLSLLSVCVHTDTRMQF